MSQVEKIALASKSASFKKRNPHLFSTPNLGGEDDAEHDLIAALALKESLALQRKEKPAKRLKQSTKPLVNKLESEFEAILTRSAGLIHVRAQAKTYKLANGVRFTPDLTAKQKVSGQELAWEVKGPHAWEDSLVKLKVAAVIWPDVRWTLVWKVKGVWHEQVVLP